MSICESNQCGNWGQSSNGQVGCTLHTVGPSHIGGHILRGGACLATKPLFDAATETAETTELDEQPLQVKVVVPVEEVPIPTSDYLVIAVAAGEPYEKQAEIVAPRMAEYASRIGADFVLLTGDKFPAWPMANKYRILDYAKHYKVTLQLDCDVVVMPNAPSIFDEVPEGMLAVFNEYESIHWHGGGTDWIQREGDLITRSQGLPDMRHDWMINAGVFLLPHNLINYYAPPSQPISPLWCAEQQLFTIRCAMGNPPIKFLDRHWNFSYIERDFWHEAKKANFVHLNGSRPLAYRLELLRRMVAGNFERLDPPDGIGFLPNWLR